MYRNPLLLIAGIGLFGFFTACGNAVEQTEQVSEETVLKILRLDSLSTALDSTTEAVNAQKQALKEALKALAEISQ